MLATAANIGLMTMDLAYKFFEPVSELIRRGQDTGAFRADLVPEDTPRLILMIAGTLPSFAPGSEGWRRYLDMVVDGLAPAAHNTQLAPPSPVREHHATLRLHLAPGLRVTRKGTIWTIASASRRPVAALVANGVEWTESSSPYHPEFGREFTRPCLCARIAFRDRLVAKWWLLLGR